MDSNIIFPQLPTYTGTVSPGGFLSLAITVGLPLLAGLFMRWHWSAFQKGLILLGFAAAKAFLEAWLVAVNAHDHFDVGAVGYSTAVQFGIAVIAYFGLIRNTKAQRAAIVGGIVRSTVIEGEVKGT